MGLMKDLQGLGAAYASMHQKTDESYTLTAADKRGNTVAWQNRKKKNVKTGQPLYKYADHLQKEEESRLWDEVAHNLTELHELGGVKFKVIPINEPEGLNIDETRLKGSPKGVTLKPRYGDHLGDMYSKDPDEGDLETSLKDSAKKRRADTIRPLKQRVKATAKKLAKEETIKEKESYKTVAAVIDYDRSKKGTDDATYDSEHGEKKKAKKERDYAAWEREKMKKDDPNWKHKKGSTSESVQEDAQSDAVAQMSGAGGDPQSDAVKQVSGGGKKSKKGNAHAEMDRIRKTMASQKVKKEDKDWGYDKDGNSLNPVDIEKRKKKDDDLAGSPNKVKEALEASGIFTAEEIENLLWNEFDEGYQRDPEKGEEEARKADKRSAKQKRMDDPKRGINSPAFKEFMRSRGM